MHLVLIGWGYVVVMMAVAEALAPNGTVLGALPLWIVLYVMGTSARRRAREKREAASEQPDAGGEAAGDAVPPEREEP
jgi:hypothetical protein